MYSDLKDASFELLLIYMPPYCSVWTFQNKCIMTVKIGTKWGMSRQIMTPNKPVLAFLAQMTAEFHQNRVRIATIGVTIDGRE